MIFQSDSTIEKGNTLNTEMSDSIKSDTTVNNEIKIQTSQIHVSAPLLKPRRNIDSLFIVLERKDAEIKKFKEKQEKENALKQQKLNVKIDSLPGQFDIYDSAHTYIPLKSDVNFDNTAASVKPIFNKTQEIPDKDIDAIPIARKTFPTDFYLVIILLITILIVTLKKIFSKNIASLFQTAFNYQLTNKWFRDRNVFQSRFNFILNLVYIINLSIFLYQFTYFFDIKSNQTNVRFVYILTIIISIIMVRYVILNILGEIFKVQREYKEYIFNQLMFNKLLGLILLPVVFFILYVPENLRSVLLIAGIIMIIINFFIKLIRGYTIIIKKDVLLFYVLLYLCTLEILPVLVGLTYFKRLI